MTAQRGHIYTNLKRPYNILNDVVILLQISSVYEILLPHNHYPRRVSMSNSKMQQGEFCWNELMTSDTNKAEKFYSGLLGWEFQKHDMGKMVYTMISKGDKHIGGMMQVPEEQKNHIPSHWMSYISVDDVDDIAKKAQTLGQKLPSL